MSLIVMCHDKHGICPFLSGLIIPLSHASEILTKDGLPGLCSGKVIHQLFVAQNGFDSNWVYHWAYKVFGMHGW
jgi:hypothetical protein